jgi:membrane protease YdiL (CAAX protease family)
VPRRGERPDDGAAPPPRTSGRATGNAFGLLEAGLGIVAGFLLSAVIAGAYLDLSHHPKATDSLGAVICSLIGLWCGLLGGAVVASRAGRAAGAGATGGEVRLQPSGSLAEDFGFRIRPWPDLLTGVVVGVASQLLLVPLLELPLAPFVHNLSKQVGKPAQELTQDVHGLGLVVLALFVCVGSPLVEELFFRGLLMRALLGGTARLGATLQVVVSIAVTSLLFALAHFEAIQFLGLAGFGAVLGVLAWRTGRLGPGLVAHASFNAVAIISIALAR